MVKRNDSAVTCLEEVGLARQAALRRFGEIGGRTGAQMIEGFRQFAAAARRAADSMAALARAQPAPHAFTPDLDLYCSVSGCGLGPEEHS